MYIASCPKKWDKELRGRVRAYERWLNSGWEYFYHGDQEYSSLRLSIECLLARLASERQEPPAAVTWRGMEVYDDIRMVRRGAQQLIGMCHMRLGQIDACLAIFDELRREDPDNFHYVETCVDVLLLQGRVKDAAEIINGSSIETLLSEGKEGIEYLRNQVVRHPELLGSVRKDLVDRVFKGATPCE